MNAQGIAEAANALRRERRAARQATARAVGRIAMAVVRLCWEVVAFIAYWAWTRRRAVVAFRRELRRAGLPPGSVTGLTRDYAATGDPLHLLRLALSGKR